jgi:D-arabinono-1,4-lactone oxidase
MIPSSHTGEEERRLSVMSLDSFSSRRVHSTWAGTFRCAPELYIQPRSLDEIKMAVREATRQKKTIMLTGSGHSPSNMTMNKDWILNLDRFNKVLDVKPDVSGKFTDVTVEAGIRIYKLSEFLNAHGLAIQNLGSISEQSAAGIISTGTHGSSAYHGLVSQQMVDLTLLTGSGDLVKCSSHESTDLFRAALLSLGKLGIIVHMTIRAVPAFNLQSSQEIVSFDKFVDSQWPTFWTSSEFLRVWWYPYSKRVVLWRANKTNKCLSPPRDSFYGTTLGRFFYESLLWVAVNLYPPLTPAIERWVFSHQYGFEDTFGNGSYAVQRSDEALNMDCLFSQFVNEWAIPLTEGPRVLRELENIINQAAATGEFYVHAPLEVRISNTTVTGSTEPIDASTYDVKGAIPGNTLRPLLDSTPKLPYAKDTVAYENLTLYLNATMYRPFGFNCPTDKWYRAFEGVVSGVGGKPHWAKNFLGTNAITTTKDGQMRGLKPMMDSWFGDDLKLWKSLRVEYDPQGLFLSGREWAEINGLVD